MQLLNGLRQPIHPPSEWNLHAFESHLCRVALAVRSKKNVFMCVYLLSDFLFLTWSPNLKHSPFLHLGPTETSPLVNPGGLQSTMVGEANKMASHRIL